jgi:hypothetical protein
MQGYGDKTGLKSVQFSCTGGTVTAKAHKVLKQFWGSNLPKQGVAWTEDENCGPATTGCLLSICGQSDVVIFRATISAVKLAPGPGSEQGNQALCIAQDSRVTLRQCAFTSSAITHVAAYQSTSVLLDQCTITRNNNTIPAMSSGMWKI